MKKLLFILVTVVYMASCCKNEPEWGLYTIYWNIPNQVELSYTIIVHEYDKQGIELQRSVKQFCKYGEQYPFVTDMPTKYIKVEIVSASHAIINSIFIDKTYTFSKNNKLDIIIDESSY